MLFSVSPSLVIVGSVPSSSGQSVQHLACYLCSRVLHPFQSPLHRGNRFNDLDLDDLDQEQRRFSPLFIGAIGSTTNNCYASSRFCFGFSPLFIGAIGSTMLVF